jgi:hypothetical protein
VRYVIEKVARGLLNMRTGFTIPTRLAACLVVSLPLVTFSFLGCGGPEDTPATKAQSEEHGKAATKNMEDFMKNNPAESKKPASAPATK